MRAISVTDGQFVDNVQILNHIGKLLEANLAIKVLVRLDNGAVDQLLELNIIQIVTDHHFDDGEQLAIGNIAIVVDVVNLESKSKLLLLGGASWQRVEALDEFEEGDAPILILIKNRDNTLHKRVVSQLRNIKELLRLKTARLVLVELTEIFVKLL